MFVEGLSDLGLRGCNDYLGWGVEVPPPFIKREGRMTKEELEKKYEAFLADYAYPDETFVSLGYSFSDDLLDWLMELFEAKERETERFRKALGFYAKFNDEYGDDEIEEDHGMTAVLALRGGNVLS